MQLTCQKIICIQCIEWGLALQKYQPAAWRRRLSKSIKELPLVEDYGEGFQGRQIEWGGMIVSYETFPAGTDATPLFKALPWESAHCTQSTLFHERSTNGKRTSIRSTWSRAIWQQFRKTANSFCRVHASTLRGVRAHGRTQGDYPPVQMAAR